MLDVLFMGDNITLIAHSSDVLNATVDMCSKDAEMPGILFHVSKTKCILFDKYVEYMFFNKCTFL